MNPKTKVTVVVIIGVLAVALFVTGLIILPDTVVMQVQADGSAGTTMPKLFALLIPLAFTAIFTVLYYRNGATKHMLVALLGLAMLLLTFAFNR